MLCRSCDAPVMSAFLAQVHAQFPGDFCIVVLDGAGWHIAGDLVVPPAMHLEWLPPNSPELNPVEPIWDWVRDHHTGNRAFGSLGQVQATLGKAFRNLASMPAVVRSMTLFDWFSKLSL